MATPLHKPEPASSTPGVRASLPGNRVLWLILLVTAYLLALRLWHIRADFPDYHFYSQDGARFTDEGFYLGAAIQHFTLGRAYIPGGWNPGVFMPVWPLMAGVLFHFTCVSVVAARSLAVACTWIGVLLAYLVARQYRSRTFAVWTAFLVAVNALGFFFGRLALLEPALVMFVLLAIYLAGKVKPGGYAMAIAVGIVFTVATLTKTTGPFVLSAVLYPIWANNRGAPDRKAVWRLVGAALATAILLLGSAKIYWAHHYAADAKIILQVAPLWELQHSPLRLLRFFLRGTWIDPVLFPLALIAFVAAIARLRFFWRDTLFTTAFLWEAGYAAFIVFHYDGPPRYFVTLIVPTIWLALVFMEWLWRSHRRIGTLALVCIAISVVWNLASIGSYLAHPNYSLMDASIAIKKTIMEPEDGGGVAAFGQKLLIGRGADEISLLANGFPSMDTDGAMPLAEKLDVYHPGWFMDWTDDPPLRLKTVAEKRILIQQAIFPNLNRFNHSGIVLYQLFPENK